MPETPASYDCPALLQQLFDAIHTLTANPANVVRVRHGDHEMEYSVTSLDSLMHLYRVHWNNCGEQCGLPPLDANAATKRGVPVNFGS